jgi:hypothetical protein
MRIPLTLGSSIQFIEEMKAVFQSVSHQNIINIDETSWELVPKNIKVLHITGSDHAVRYTQVSPEQRITAVAAADGTKLPLQFIALEKLAW